MVKAVAVVRGNQLEDRKLSPLRYRQINAETKASGGGEGQPQTVTLPSQTPHAFGGRHVLQHVRLQQTRLLLQSNTEPAQWSVTSTQQALPVGYQNTFIPVI